MFMEGIFVRRNVKMLTDVLLPVKEIAAVQKNSAEGFQELGEGTGQSTWPPYRRSETHTLLKICGWMDPSDMVNCNQISNRREIIIRTSTESGATLGVFISWIQEKAGPDGNVSNFEIVAVDIVAVRQVLQRPTQKQFTKV